MKYLIDANTFITPYRGYAPMDVAVTLWDKFKDMSDSGTIVGAVQFFRGCLPCDNCRI